MPTLIDNQSDRRQRNSARPITLLKSDRAGEVEGDDNECAIVVSVRSSNTQLPTRLLFSLGCQVVAPLREAADSVQDVGAEVFFHLNGKLGSNILHRSWAHL